MGWATEKRLEHRFTGKICGGIKLHRMKVFKFGGASVSTADGIKVEAFYQNKQQQALQLFQDIKQQHVGIAAQSINWSYFIYVLNSCTTIKPSCVAHFRVLSTMQHQ